MMRSGSESIRKGFFNANKDEVKHILLRRLLSSPNVKSLTLLAERAAIGDMLAIIMISIVIVL